MSKRQKSRLLNEAKRELNRRFKKTLTESNSGCVGEIFTSDICSIGGEGYYSELSDIEKKEIDKVYDLADQVVEACNCFKGGKFTNWDEDSVKSALESVPNKHVENFKDLIYCYMKGAPDSVFKTLKANYNPVEALLRELTPIEQIFDFTDWGSVENKFGVNDE